MIAADDERGGWKLILPLNGKTGINEEERSAKGFKHGAARARRQKHILGFIPVLQSDAQFRIFCCLIRRIVRQSLAEVLALQRYDSLPSGVSTCSAQPAVILSHT
jgi:hypothetical protein